MLIKAYMDDNADIVSENGAFFGCVDRKVVPFIYALTLPFAIYFFFSKPAQARWPLIPEIALLTFGLMGCLGAAMFFVWWPIVLTFGTFPAADFLGRFGLTLILWSIRLSPLILLFEGIEKISHGDMPF